MPLRVLSCCTYLTAEHVPWRGADYDAHDFVHAVKGWPFGGYVQLTSRGGNRRISSDNCDVALQVFSEIVYDVGPRYGLVVPVALVPVPNSRCDVGCETPPRTRDQASALAEALGPGAIVADVLRWSVRLPPASSSSGTRDPQELYEKLRLIGGLPGGERAVVLVDDVLTSGGHLQACATLLRYSGLDVRLAVVAGRSDRAQVPEPFAPRLDYLSDFTPRTPKWFAEPTSC